MAGGIEGVAVPHEAFDVSSILTKSQTYRALTPGCADNPTLGFRKPDFTFNHQMSQIAQCVL